MSIPTIEIMLDNRRLKKKLNAYPVKLKVYYRGQTIPYKTIFDLSLLDWNKLDKPRISDDLCHVREEIKKIEDDARTFIRGLEQFSFYQFEQLFIYGHRSFEERKRKPKGSINQAHEFDFAPYLEKFRILTDPDIGKGFILDIFAIKIKELIQEGSAGTGLVYQNAYYSLMAFEGNKKFSEITVSYLKQYERWMREQDCGKSYVGIVLRSLRVMFNTADAKGVIDKKKCYPFGRYKYVIAKPGKKKKFLPSEGLSTFFHLETDDKDLMEARDYWIFCYLGNGMNPIDALSLQNKHKENGFFKFHRTKTEGTSRNDDEPVSSYITQEMQEILDRRGTKSSDPEAYIFPILNKDMNSLEVRITIANFTRRINARLKKLCRIKGIPELADFVLARKAAAGKISEGGASKEFIKGFLGHERVETQKHYLNDDEEKKRFAEKLTAIPKISIAETINNP